MQMSGSMKPDVNHPNDFPFADWKKETRKREKKRKKDKKREKEEDREKERWISKGSFG